MSNIVIIFAK